MWKGSIVSKALFCVLIYIIKINKISISLNRPHQKKAFFSNNFSHSHFAIYLVYRVQYAAETGVTETTESPREYSFPNNPNIKLWDTPGIGTQRYPDVEAYCKKQHIEIYDAFIIMTCTRFTNDDDVLARKLNSIGKPFLFVRGKIDIDINSEKNKKDVLDKIRKKCSDSQGDKMIKKIYTWSVISILIKLTNGISLA